MFSDRLSSLSAARLFVFLHLNFYLFVLFLLQEASINLEEPLYLATSLCEIMSGLSRHFNESSTPFPRVDRHCLFTRFGFFALKLFSASQCLASLAFFAGLRLRKVFQWILLIICRFLIVLGVAFLVGASVYILPVSSFLLGTIFFVLITYTLGVFVIHGECKQALIRRNEEFVVNSPC